MNKFRNQFGIEKLRDPGNPSMGSYPDYGFWKDLLVNVIKKSETFGVMDLTESRNKSLELVESIYPGDMTMPTADEIDELVSTQNRPNYRWDKIIVDDDEVAWKVTYLDNGNSITLPTACYKFGTTLIYSISIWSSSLDPLYPYEAFFLCLYNTGLDLSFDTRSDGVPIRPVCD